MGIKSGNKFIGLLVLFFILQSVVNALPQDTSTSRIYFGASFGLLNKNIGYSQFFPKVGGSALYNWDNNFVALSYNRLYEFQISLGGIDNSGNANFHRFELLYGYTTIISKKHKLLKHISFSAAIGLSYNYIRYFKDDKAEYFNNLSTARSPGIPIGISLTNNIGKAVYFGWELKYQILSKYPPYGEYNVFLMASFY